MTGVKLHPGGSYNNTGTITGYLYGIYIYGGAGSVTNSGSITAAAIDGIGVEISGGAGLVTNSGTITATGFEGIAVDLLNGGTVANSGTISAAEAPGIGVEISGGTGIVTNSGAISATVGELEFVRCGVELLDGGTVTNVQGGAIRALSFGVYVDGACGTVTNAGTISGSYQFELVPTGQGVTLRAGGTVTNDNGGTISGGEGVYIEGGSGTVTNSGDIAGGYCGVNVADGGTVTNAGTISAEEGVPFASAGVKMGDGGTVINEQGGSISTTGEGPNLGQGVDITGATGTVTNAGAIAGDGAEGIGVLLGDGGTVNNEASGTIVSAIGPASVAVYGAGIVTNSGAITGDGFKAIGVSLHDGGTVTNAAGATIGGGADGGGVAVSGAAGQITNAGAIAGTGLTGVSLRAGGSVANQNGGTIAGGAYGLEIYGAAGSVANSGAISGSKASVQFKGSGANRLTLRTGSMLSGDAMGSTAAGATNTLILQGAGTADNSFVDFNTLKLLARGSWALGGNSAISTATLSTGALIVAGELTTSLNESAGVAVTIDRGDALTLDGSSSLSWAIGGAGTLLLAGGSTAIDGGATVSTAKLSIAGDGTRAIVTEDLRYNHALSAGAGTTVNVQAGDTLTLTGTSTLAGLVNGLGALDLAGGTTAIDAGASLVETGWLISGSGALVTLDEALRYAGAFGESDGATLDLLAGALTLTGSAGFSGGTVDGAHPLITKGATEVGGLTLGGTVDWTDMGVVTESGGNLTLGDGSGAEAILNIASIGTWEITDESGVALGASTLSHIVNAGLFEKTGGAATSAIAAEIVNDGTIVAAMGTLDLQGTVAGIGTSQVDAGATLEVDGTVSAGQTICYAGAGGGLLLEDLNSSGSNLFHGTISGFGAGDVLDAGAPFDAGTTFHFNSSTGNLDLSDVTAQGAIHASIHFLGNYTNANFTQTSDLDGGTLITYKPST